MNKFLRLAFSTTLAGVVAHTNIARAETAPEPLPDGRASVTASSRYLFELDGRLASLDAVRKGINAVLPKKPSKFRSFLIDQLVEVHQDQKEARQDCHDIWGRLEATANLPLGDGRMAREQIDLTKEAVRLCKDTWRPIPFRTTDEVVNAFDELQTMNQLLSAGGFDVDGRKLSLAVPLAGRIKLGDDAKFCMRQYDRMVATATGRKGVDPDVRARAREGLRELSKMPVDTCRPI